MLLLTRKPLTGRLSLPAPGIRPRPLSMKPPAIWNWLLANASRLRRRCNWPPPAPVKQAEAALNQRDVDVGELTVHAPIAAQVTTRVASLGENFSAGSPLFSLIDMRNIWFTFNLREDLLGGLKIGDTFDVTVPAFKSQVMPVRVTMINVQGQYATWRATRATGDFDLRTFEVRAVP